MSAERWSVEISRHERDKDREYETAEQELKVFLTAEQVALVRTAVLVTLANNKPMGIMAAQGVKP